MKRSDFLKIFGVVILSPTVLVPNGDGVVKEVSTELFNPIRWPIYPQKVMFSFKEANGVASTIFTYVKINRNETDYLIPVRATRINDDNGLKNMFESLVAQTDENFVVCEGDSFLFDNGLIIKYDPNIHKG